MTPGATLKHSRPTSSAWLDSVPSVFVKFVLHPEPQTQLSWHARGFSALGFACQPGLEASTWATETPAPVRFGSRCRMALMPIASASAKVRHAQATIVRIRMQRTRGTRPSGRRRIGLLDQRAYDLVTRDWPVVAAVFA